MRYLFSLVVLASSVACSVLADEPKLPPPADRKIDFVKDVQPLFAARCYECHGPKKQESAFRLDHKGTALHGGELGQAIVPGKSGESPLVKYVAGKLGSWLPPHVEEGDLISYGLLGLIGAIERFDINREIKFETFAISRIRGAMIDELRSLDWVPRSVRNRAREIERAMAELENRHKRTPSDEEVAGELGITVGEFEESLTQIARSSVVALDELWSGSGAGGESTALIDTIEDPHAPDPTRELLQGEMRQALAQAITRLPDRERLVVTLYYYEELTLREIGEVLSVTESRVSQLHTKAILRLRVRLQGSLDHAA